MGYLIKIHTTTSRRAMRPSDLGGPAASYTSSSASIPPYHSWDRTQVLSRSVVVLLRVGGEWGLLAFGVERVLRVSRLLLAAARLARTL